jgi:hypothetical protein
MRAREFIVEASKKLGRAFNHLEDLVFFYGSAGTIEALEHLRDVATKEGGDSVRMKWDGNPQVYWGRINGEFIPPHGHAQWSRGVIPKTSDDVAKYIMSTGKASTPEEVASRQAFADKFASLSDMFERATPPTLDGKDTFFVYADALFLNTPELQDGVYTFCPNPHSKTCYHVRKDSELGKRISRAKVMVVGHAYFPEHGMPDSAQVPIKDFSVFNGNPELIVQGPIYNTAPLKVDTSSIDAVEREIKQNAAVVDKFLEGGKGMSDLKNVIYKYVNQTAKAKQLDQLSTKHFAEWMDRGGVTGSKMKNILALNDTNNNALDVIFKIVKDIQTVKDTVIDQLEAGHSADIWDTEGEGRVRYADANKQFGNVKFVPRKRWTPAE